MKKTKLLSEAISAYIDGHKDIAEQKMRQYFIESAVEINKELEESFEEVQEDLHQDPSSDFNQDIQYPLDEEKEEEVEAEETEESEFDPESQEGSTETIEVPEDQWAEIERSLQELQAIFAEAGNEEETEETEEEIPSEDEFGEVKFGEDEFTEGYKMKPVTKPSETEEGNVNKKSPVAPNAKSPVEGVKPVSVDQTEGDEGEKPAVNTEDNNNVMNSDKELMKPVQEPKHKAENDKSVLPKQKK